MERTVLRSVHAHETRPRPFVIAKEPNQATAAIVLRSFALLYRPERAIQVTGALPQANLCCPVGVKSESRHRFILKVRSVTASKQWWQENEQYSSRNLPEVFRCEICNDP